MKKIVLIILLLAVCSYGDDTTYTICPSGCDTTSLPAALDVFDGFDVTALGAGDSLKFEISGIWPGPDSGIVNVDGITTDSDNGILIYATGDARNTSGVWDDTKYILRNKNANNQRCMDVEISYVEIDGLQFDFYRDAGTSFPYCIYEEGDPTDITVCNNIFRRNPADTATAISAMATMFNTTAGKHLYFYNNLVDGFNVGSDGFGLYALTDAFDDSSVFMYNNTFVDCDVAIRNTNDNLVAKNNIFVNCGTCVYNNDVAHCDYNATDGVALGYTPNTNDSLNAVFSFENAGASNWKLTAEFAGVDLSGDPDLAFSTDGLGNLRTVTWCRGFHEYDADSGDKKMIIRK